MTTGEVIALIKAFGGSGGGGGTGGGVLVVHGNESNVLDHTWKEIAEADFAIWNVSGYSLPLIYVGEHSGEYTVAFWSFDDSVKVYFITNSENGYPVIDA